VSSATLLLSLSHSHVSYCCYLSPCVPNPMQAVTLILRCCLNAAACLLETMMLTTLNQVRAMQGPQGQVRPR
jgi:hypothetical protein